MMLCALLALSPAIAPQLKYERFQECRNCEYIYPYQNGFATYAAPRESKPAGQFQFYNEDGKQLSTIPVRLGDYERPVGIFQGKPLTQRLSTHEAPPSDFAPNAPYFWTFVSDNRLVSMDHYLDTLTLHLGRGKATLFPKINFVERFAWDESAQTLAVISHKDRDRKKPFQLETYSASGKLIRRIEIRGMQDKQEYGWDNSLVFFDDSSVLAIFGTWGHEPKNLPLIAKDKREVSPMLLYRITLADGKATPLAAIYDGYYFGATLAGMVELRRDRLIVLRPSNQIVFLGDKGLHFMSLKA